MDTVDEYIASFPAETQSVLRSIRRGISAIVPAASEVIRYNMPTLQVGDEYLVCYAAWKHHIGMYPIPTLSPQLEKAMDRYRWSKDTMRFRYRDPIPYDLIGQAITEIALSKGLLP